MQRNNKIEPSFMFAGMGWVETVEFSEFQHLNGFSCFNSIHSFGSVRRCNIDKDCDDDDDDDDEERT